MIQSKCGGYRNTGGIKLDSRGSSFGPQLDSDYICGAVDSSLRRLGIDQLDILLLHVGWPLTKPDHVAAAFEKLTESGKVRHFEVSNHTAMQMELLRNYVRQPLITNQILVSEVW